MNKRKKHLGSLRSIVEFYEELYNKGVIQEGSSGFSRMLQLLKYLSKYGRGQKD